MSWTRRAAAALAVCVLLPTGPAGCGPGGGEEPGTGASPASAGGLPGGTDGDGRRHREADAGREPEVDIEVQPHADDGWDVRLTVRNFRFSPAGTEATAVAGRGVARLFVDGDLVASLRGPRHHLAAGLVPRGTHHVTARLYADDGTVWAVDGEPVESTADITVSDPEPTGASGPALRGGAGPTGAAGPVFREGAGPTGAAGPVFREGAAPSVAAVRPRTGGHGSPDRGGKAS
ncbi:hypothetical protein [Streptomyces sp. JHA26]|uniref:hypothetical protein n=1 Tax=Streptomyces sp. JHA26 TaxID=1917143 RepID=UPI00098A2814|nr:hypothetical protein [Streptomyces sp. JHA26]